MSVTHPTPPAPANPTPAGSPDALPPLPNDVRAFSDRHGLAEHIAATARLLRETFPPPGDITLELFTDPESEDESPWVAVVVTVRSSATVPEMLRHYNDFLERWVAVTPAPVRDQMIPKFTFA
jgi:hypothetical protein